MTIDSISPRSFVLIFLGLVAGTCLASGSLKRAGGILAAEGFLLVDDRGKTRGGLALGKDGKVALVLADEKEVPRLGLGIQEKASPYINLLDDKGEVRSALVLLPNEESVLTFFDTQGKHRLRLAIDADGRGSLNIYNSESSVRLGFGISKDGSAGVTLRDDEGNPRIALAAKDSSPAVFFYGTNGSKIAQITDQKGSRFGLEVFDGSGRRRCLLGLSEKEERSFSTLSFFDEKGVPTLSLPAN